MELKVRTAGNNYVFKFAITGYFLGTTDATDVTMDSAVFSAFPKPIPGIVIDTSSPLTKAQLKCAEVIISEADGTDTVIIDHDAVPDADSVTFTEVTGGAAAGHLFYTCEVDDSFFASAGPNDANDETTVVMVRPRRFQSQVLSSGDASTIVFDEAAVGSNDDLNAIFAADTELVGWYIEMTSGTHSGEVRKISVYTFANETITLEDALPGSPSDNDTFVVYNGDAFDPATGVLVSLRTTETGDTETIEGVDATNQIRDSVLADSTLFNGAEVNALWDAFRNSIFHPKQDDWRLVLVSGSLPVGVSIDVYGTNSLLADDWANAAGTLANNGAWSDGAQQGALENTATVLDFGGTNEFDTDVYIALEVSGDSQSTWTRAITWNLKGLKPSPTYIRIDGRFQYAGGSGLANNIVGVITSVEDTYLGTDYLGLISNDAQALPNLDVAIGVGGIPVGAFVANSITDAAIASDAEVAIATAVNDIIIESNGSITRQQAESIVLSAVAGVTTTGGTLLKDPSGTTSRIGATINANNERTVMSLTPST